MPFSVQPPTTVTGGRGTTWAVQGRPPGPAHRRGITSVVWGRPSGLAHSRGFARAVGGRSPGLAHSTGCPSARLLVNTAQAMRWFGWSPASATLAFGAGARAAPAAACVLSASDIQDFAARGPERQVGAILPTPESRGPAGSRLRSGRLGASFGGPLTPGSRANKSRGE